MKTFPILIAVLCLGATAEAATVDKALSPVAKLYDKQLTTVENEVVSLAEAMPADKYDFAPTDGEFKGVRTFGQQLKHLGATNYGMAATVLGEKMPVDVGKEETGPDRLKNKDEIVQFVKDSFAYMHKAEATLSDSNLTDQMASAFDASRKMSRGYAANIPIWHSFDHYGQMVVYARMNGIVPPASRQ